MEQNKISRRNFLRVAGASATAAAMGGLVPAASAAGIKDLWSMDLQILATSDTHGKFDPWDYAANKADASGSVAQQATAIKENRTKTTLVVDAGDTIQANSAELFLNDDVHPMIAAQNAIGYRRRNGRSGPGCFCCRHQRPVEHGPADPCHQRYPR